MTDVGTLIDRATAMVERINARDLDGYMSGYASTVIPHGYPERVTDFYSLRGFYRQLLDARDWVPRRDPACRGTGRRRRTAVRPAGPAHWRALPYHVLRHSPPRVADALNAGALGDAPWSRPPVRRRVGMLELPVRI